ncbi:MAG: hypothetical protein PUF13_10380 [Lachnospiraceae bacterium]|nr:hypothetical protein [Lachnospiraceae bacterium]
MSEKKPFADSQQKNTPVLSLDGYDHLGNICSAGDCTGLIPALPSTEEELEAYEEMYQFCPQEPDMS